MPKPLQYRSGAIIYFQGDPANQVFILQKGKVNLAYQDMETNEDQHDFVQPGEFFGVKSALGRYPREENAVAVQDATVMAFTVPEFEALAAANTRIIMKMLKVFSNQLRRVHRQVSSIMEKEEKNPETGLFSIGEYYLKNRRFGEAKYVFSRYLTYYPSGKNAQQAARNLETAENSLPRYGEAAPSARAPEPVAPPPEKTVQSQPDAAKAYYDALNLIPLQKYQQAYLSFKKIIDANEDVEYCAKSFLEIGHCLFHLGKADECIKHYTVMITKYPKHPDLADALFYMGQSYEKMNRKDQAAVFYKKILSLTGNEDDGTRIKAKKALNDLEA
jgi:CRP-like cAMP-binding protein